MEICSFKNKEGKNITYYKWGENLNDPKGIIQLAHGMSEWALRYSTFSEEMVKEGYVIYANDHSGHGNSSKSMETLGYISKKDDFYTMIDDMKTLNDIIKNDYEDSKVILLGHSMGSFLSQRYFEMYGQNLDALILSGSNGRPKYYTKLGLLIAKIETLMTGGDKRSKVMDKLSFGGFNKAFKNAKTEVDWLTRDEKEVEKFIEDKFTGFIYPTKFYSSLISGIWDIHKKENLKKINLDIPIYIFSGDKDPVGYFGKGILNLCKVYKNLGVKNITCNLYEDGRHEMLNEINKNEVIKDMINWLKNNL